MLTKKEIYEIKRFSKLCQMEICKMIAPLPAGHLGGSLSISDTLSVLYNKHLRHNPKDPKWPERDRLIMSKGHCGPALYAALALRGFFPLDWLATLNQPGTNLPSHCDRIRTPGIDMSTGSLGQGASTAAGVAAALKLNGSLSYVYLILGDGEIQEGQVWEMAMFAATRHLNNLIALVDYNKLQLDGPCNDDKICNVGDLAAKFSSFGWNAETINGHDPEEIDAAILHAKDNRTAPSAIILDTIKGVGWSKTAGQVFSHGYGFQPGELEEALSEMQSELDRLEEEYNENV